MRVWRKLLKFIFGEPRKVQDDFFGQMIDAGGYYECYGFFNPINKKIELGIGGDETGPTKEARLFYFEIESNYQKLVELIIPVVQKTFNNWNPKVEIHKFTEEFEPVYIFIPDCKSENINWRIAYETIHDSHMITIEFNNYVIENVIIDG